MNTINSGAFKIDPSQMMQKMQDKFASADADENGSISKAELTANAPEGANQSRIDKMFARLDTDENGEITAEEQKAMMDQIAERMSSMSSNDSFIGSLSGFDGFSSLLDTLQQSTDDGEETGYLEQLKEKLGDENLTQQALSQSLQEFTQKYPRIDVTA